ncbi:ADP-dependent NAD(P)H-hydrate dehydratase [Candidatus Gastranaerophilus sp. (ex Termes propinquus)]|nr:ADP-dependent NAD(P)H-hydrate dehydratase [Candidatus Gastranaerophilus sp. (ex Termes propinquus)]
MKISYINKELVKEFLPVRVQKSNKGTYGNVLNIAGSSSYPGAAFLSSVSALRVGAGYVMLATTSSNIPIVASNTPDVTFLDLGESATGTVPRDSLKFIQGVANPHCYSVGCGLSVTKDSKEFLISFLNKYAKSQTPIIIDADGINILAQANKVHLPLNSIITPHPLELARLMKTDVEEVQADRVKWAWKTSEKYDCIVLLKGHETVIAVPNGQVFVNKSGNSALSKAPLQDLDF